MIPSRRKVSRELFKALMKSGRFYQSDSFSVRYNFIPKLSFGRFSVVVSKKNEKKATGRNYLKRKMYSILRPFLKQARADIICAFFVKKTIFEKSRHDLELEVKQALTKIHAID